MMSTRHQRRRTSGSSGRRCCNTAATTLSLLCLSTLSRAQTNPFDCNNASLDGASGKVTYNLTSLAGLKVLTRTRETPPTKFVDELRFDLCSDVPKKEDVADSDQCPLGTRGCLTMTNQKDSNDRVVSVVRVAASESLKPDLKLASSPDGLNIIFHGASYPTTDPIPQSLNVTLLCDATKISSTPEFKSYDGASVQVEWWTAAGCRVSPEDPGEGGGGGKEGEKVGGGDEDVGSGIGWFFLLFLLAFVVYFALGAYYNYSTYGATGADLIPHRDFWRDVPYIIRDVISHLCSTVRPKRGGYIAV